MNFKSFLFFGLLMSPCLSVVRSAEPAAAPVASEPQETLTLSQAFDLALKASEDLRIGQEHISQAQARYVQTRALILPDISWKLTHLIQDTSGVSTGGSGTDRTNTKKYRTESRFALEQPLFSGFREFSAMKGYLKEREREDLLLRRATLLLFNRVAVAFYEVIRQQTEIENHRANLGITGDRLKELKERTRLGKSRDSELLTAESQWSVTKADEQASLGDLEIAKQNLALLLGVDVRPYILVDPIQGLPAAVVEDEYVSKLGVRSDVKAYLADAESKKYGVRVAKGGFSPDAGLTANYYTKRTGFQSEIDWDVLFDVNVPIFQGGATLSDIKDARSRYEEAKLVSQRVQREAHVEIQTAVASLNSSLAEAAALNDAYNQLKRSYGFYEREYRLGLVNNLEVIQVQNDMRDAKHDLDTARIQAKLDWFGLRAAVEELP